MFICCSRSYSHEDGDIAKKKKKSLMSRLIGSKDSTKKNPYADRGLDRFYTLLSDHEDKKQKIYKQMGFEEISFVRFVYSDVDLRPIVVRVKNKNIELINAGVSAIADHGLGGKSNFEQAVLDHDQGNEKGTTTCTEEKICRRWINGRFIYCFAVIIVLILLFLAVHGRSFAILCTTIMWYLVPSVSEEKRIY